MLRHRYLVVWWLLLLFHRVMALDTKGVGVLSPSVLDTSNVEQQSATNGNDNVEGLEFEVGAAIESDKDFEVRDSVKERPKRLRTVEQTVRNDTPSPNLRLRVRVVGDNDVLVRPIDDQPVDVDNGNATYEGQTGSGKVLEGTQPLGQGQGVTQGQGQALVLVQSIETAITGLMWSSLGSFINVTSSSQPSNQPSNQPTTQPLIHHASEATATAVPEDPSPDPSPTPTPSTAPNSNRLRANPSPSTSPSLRASPRTGPEIEFEELSSTTILSSGCGLPLDSSCPLPRIHWKNKATATTNKATTTAAAATTTTTATAATTANIANTNIRTASTPTTTTTIPTTVTTMTTGTAVAAAVSLVEKIDLKAKVMTL